MMRTALRHRGLQAAATSTAIILAGVLLAACGVDKKDRPVTQTAAKVNKEEITVHQINAVLAQQRGLRPDQADEASRRALERLIDQELAVQKAAEMKLDRDPRVLQAVEAARREIIARTYTDRLSEGAPKPGSAEVKKYYEDHPALFRERRVYQLQELAIKAHPVQLEALRAMVKSGRTSAELIEYLRANGLKFVGNHAVRAAEQIPLSVLPELAKLKDGNALLTPGPDGANVTFLVSSRAQPVHEAQAVGVIEQFLLNERKRKLVLDDLKALRAAAKIEYVGRYEAAAVEVPKVAGPAEVAASAAAAMETKSGNDAAMDLTVGARATRELLRSDAAVKAASGVDAATVSKGMGLK